MSSLILPSVHRRQPQQLLPIDRGNPLGAKVIEHIALNGTSRALLSGSTISYGLGGSTQNSNKGRSLRGSGSASRASVPLDLSKYSAITIAFWLYWDSYANDDALAMEHGATYAMNNGIIIDPNCSSPAAFMFGTGGNAGESGSNLATFPRPSAGAWHRITLVIDRLSAVGAPGMAYVDGVLQTMSPFPGATATTGNFGADTLHLLSRNENALFGVGNLQDITIYRGVLSSGEIAQDYANPWQIFKAPPRRLWVAPIASQVNTATITWAEANDTASMPVVVTNRATALWSEGGEAMSAGAVLTDRGALAWIEQGDVHALSVAAASPPMAVTASLAWTDEDDGAVVIARLTNSATLAYSEKNDTWQVSVNSALPPATPAPNIYAATIMRATSTNRTANIGPASINITTGFP